MKPKKNKSYSLYKDIRKPKCKPCIPHKSTVKYNRKKKHKGNDD